MRQALGGWSADVQVNDDIGEASLYNPDLAVDSDGNLHAVWDDIRNGDYDIFASYRPAAGTWSADVEVSDDETGASQRNPAVSIMTNNSAATVWVDEREEVSSIYGAGRPAGRWYVGRQC